MISYSFLCPTKGRPEFMKRAVDSILSTVSDKNKIEIFLGLDEDDDFLMQYDEIFYNNEESLYYPLCQYRIVEGMTVGQIWNHLYKSSSGKTIVLMNDDLVMKTQNWDIIFDNEIQKYDDEIYCLFPDDCIQKDPLFCTFPFISRKACELLGYFTPECFNFYFHDSEIADIYKRIGRLKKVPQIIWQHDHYTRNPEVKQSQASIGVGEIDTEIYKNREQIRIGESKKLLEYINICLLNK